MSLYRHIMAKGIHGLVSRKSMSSYRQVLSYQRLRESTAWRLLGAQLAPVILGILEEHLHGSQTRLPASLLLERIERDLQALRDAGQELPQTARGYVSDWLAAGYLERFLPAGSNEEEYRLSPAASQAIQIIRSMAAPRSTTTESRLSLVAQQLRQLADETDPDIERRRRQLLAQRGRLDEQLEALEAGELEPMAPKRALERAGEILDLAGELASDFGQVAQAFEALHRELREQLLEEDKARGEVLEALFDGVDVIADSEAGRSFEAFWQLLTDPMANADLENALEQLLSREFVAALEPTARRFLMHLPQVLLKRGGEVHEVQQRFARSLKHFVQSGEFREQRRLLARLRQAQRQAMTLTRHLPPLTRLDQELILTSAEIASPSQWRLYDPVQHRVAGHMDEGEAAEISLDSIGHLVRHAEIDFTALTHQLRDLLSRHSQLTVAELLDHYPPDQGLGSIIGLLVMAHRHATLIRGEYETVRWIGSDGLMRRGRLPLMIFERECCNELFT
ncbi:MAG: DUF3375 domain-containing protein [Pseudomonadota bacterium]